MIIDGQLLFSLTQDLTQLAAGTPTPSTNVLDLSTARDIGVSDHVMVFAVCPTLPASGTAGATILNAVQGSPDNVNWTTIEDFGAVPISSLGPSLNAVGKGQLAYSPQLYRYMRLLITVSAAFTAGTLTSGIDLDVGKHFAYPRNYTA